MKALKKFLTWLLISSENPYKWSLTIKGTLTMGITYVLFFAGIFHVNIAQNDLKNLVDVAVKIVETTLTLISVIATGCGLVRKIALTITGENKVVNTINRNM